VCVLGLVRGEGERTGRNRVDVILIKSRHGYPPTLLHGLCLSRAPGNLLDTFQARSHIRTHTHRHRQINTTKRETQTKQDKKWVEKGDELIQQMGRGGNSIDPAEGRQKPNPLENFCELCMCDSCWATSI
jgi:hypothetical protein